MPADNCMAGMMRWVQGYPAVVSAMIDTVHPGDIEFINRAKGRDCIVEIYAHIKEDIINAYWINKKLAKVLAFWAICGIISARENAEIGKKPFHFCFMGAVKMYKYRSKQISFTDFNTLIGMKLNPNNR